MEEKKNEIQADTTQVTAPTTNIGSKEEVNSPSSTPTNQKEKKQKKKKMPFALKVILVLLVVILIFFLAAAGGSWWYLNHKLDKMDYVDIGKEDIEVNSGVTESLNAYRNIALLGLDTRDDSFSGSRSDCIIIVSINNKTNDVKLLSIYRDTYLDIDGYGLDKITHAYAYGGPRLTLSTLNKNLDLNITEFVTVNFETVKTVVNALGGITIDITSAEATQIPGISKAGKYTLNGDQALAYSRIRKIDTDYKRTERMRTVLTAVFEKAKARGISELNELTDVILPHLSTNISKNEIISLLPNIFSYKVTESVGWPYKTQGITLDRWYGIPITLESNVKQLHEDLFGETDYSVSDTVKTISSQIVKKTGYTN
ncbi:MAG: LCP family protein [Clostridia bacterium]